MIENESINKAIEYIYENINEKLTVDDVANYCNISKYHFCRLFKKEVGESPYSFIKRNRISLSAVSIKMEKEKPITEIGLDCGYSSSNYATAFKEVLNQSPIQFRKERNKINKTISHPFFNEKSGELKTFEEYEEKIVIKELPEREIYYNRFVGNYIDLRSHWIKFMEENKNNVRENTLWIERSYSDPDIVELERCVCDVCITVEKNQNIKPNGIIKGGKYAIYPFAGHASQIYIAYQGIFYKWLPQSKYKLRCNDIYDIIYVFDTNTDTVEMDICIPIE